MPKLVIAEISVGVSGLEPEKTGPESVVLPITPYPTLFIKKPQQFTYLADYCGKSLLGYPDSNQKKQDQNLLCCQLHHTPKKWFRNHFVSCICVCFLITGAKVQAFFISTKLFPNFFQKKSKIIIFLLFLGALLLFWM